MKQQPDRSREYWEDTQQTRRAPTHPVVEAFAVPKVNYMLSLVDLGNSPKLLDVGCGNGYITYRFPERLRPIGVDLSAAMLAQNPCRPLIQGSASELPFQSACFDLVYCTNLLHHVPDPGLVLSEMMRVTRRYVAMCEPNRWNPLMMALGLAKSEERGTLRSAPRRMRGLVEATGLTVIDQRTAGFVTPTRMPEWLARIVRGWNAPNPLAAYSMIVAEKHVSR